MSSATNFGVNLTSDRLHPHNLFIIFYVITGRPRFHKPILSNKALCNVGVGACCSSSASCSHLAVMSAFRCCGVWSIRSVRLTQADLSAVLLVDLLRPYGFVFSICSCGALLVVDSPGAVPACGWCSEKSCYFPTIEGLP